MKGNKLCEFDILVKDMNMCEGSAGRKFPCHSPIMSAYGSTKPLNNELFHFS